MATTATLAKKWRGKKKSKAKTGTKMLASEDEVPAEYLMAKQYCVSMTGNADVTIGSLFEWALNSFGMFFFKHDAMNGQQLQPYFVNLWEFVMNYCFPAMGYNVCCVDSTGNPICWTGQPGAGLGNGAKNRATDMLTKQGVKLTGPDHGFCPCDFTYTKDGATVTHTKNGPGSILDIMCHYDRFTSKNPASQTTQQKFADLKQSNELAFCGIPDYSVVKKYAVGGDDPAGARCLILESKANKECLLAVKFGVGYGKEYGTVFFNWADSEHGDADRLWKGSMANAYRPLNFLILCSDKEENEKSWIPETFKPSLSAFGEMPLAFDGVPHADYTSY